MKVLVIGAGVIGSLYAARLHQAHVDVTLLARGARDENLRQRGIMIKDMVTGTETISKVPVTSEINPTDFYDLIIVTVRLDQLDAVIQTLSRHKACPLVMLMLNIPDGLDTLVKALAPRQVIFGFPGAGGTLVGEVIHYIQIAQQKTTIGTLDGRHTDEARAVRALWEKAGFKTVISLQMAPWLQIHSVFMASVCAAIHQENGDSVQLGNSRSAVLAMIEGIREGFRACQQLGVPVVPSNLKTIFLTMPRWVSVRYWQSVLKGPTGTLAIAPHARAATGEMRLIAQKVLSFVHSSSVETPSLDNLLKGFLNQTSWVKE